MMNDRFKELPVRSITSLTSESKSITLKTSEVEGFDAEPGQFLTLRLKIGEEVLHRSYSISRIASNGDLTISVKKVPGGKVSTYLVDRSKEGDVLEVSPPVGSFLLPKFIEEGTDLFFFAAGSGITPILPMLELALKEYDSVRCHLLFGNKDVEDIMFREELEALKKEQPDRFDVHYFLSRPNGKRNTRGRIDKINVVDTLDPVFKESKAKVAFLCGPEPMMDEVSVALKERGVDGDRILRESFTRTQSRSKLNEAQKDCRLQVVKDGQTFEAKGSQQESLLASILDHGLDVAFSCESGLCLSCYSKVLEGDVTVGDSPALSPGEREKGFVLTCQAFPASDFVKLSYDH